MKKAFLITTLIISAFFFTQKVKAAPYFENFDLCPVGTLVNCPGWQIGGDTKAQATSTDAISIPNSAYSQWYSWHTDYATSNNFDFSFDINPLNDYISTNLGDAPNVLSFQITTSWYDFMFFNGADFHQNRQFATDTWYHIEIKDVGGVYNLYIDGQNVQNYTTSTYYSHTIGLYGRNETLGAYWDNISMNDYLPVVSNSFFSDTSGFSITNPTNCTYSKMASNTSNIIIPVAFQFTNASDSGIIFTQIKTNFYDSTGSSTSYVFSNNKIYPDTAIAYGANVILPAKNYRIEFEANGYYEQNGIPISVITGGNDINGTPCKCTSVGYQTGTDNLQVCNYGEVGFLQCQQFLTNCKAQATTSIDNIVCDFEGFGLSLVCPSEATLGKTLSIINDAKTRFPFNYISSAQNSIFLLSSDTSATSSATSTWVAGDLSFFSRFKEVSVLAKIRELIGYLLIIITGIYVIRYGSKELLA